MSTTLTFSFLLIRVQTLLHVFSSLLNVKVTSNIICRAIERMLDYSIRWLMLLFKSYWEDQGLSFQYFSIDSNKKW